MSKPKPDSLNLLIPHFSGVLKNKVNSPIPPCFLLEMYINFSIYFIFHLKLLQHWRNAAMTIKITEEKLIQLRELIQIEVEDKKTSGNAWDILDEMTGCMILFSPKLHNKHC